MTDWAAFNDTCCDLVQVDLDGLAGAVAIIAAQRNTRRAATRAHLEGDADE